MLSNKKFKNISKKLWLRSIIFFLGAIFIFYSLTLNIKQNKIVQGDTIFVLDVSNSMNTKDVFLNNTQTTRLELAKNLIQTNVEKIDSQFGLILLSDKLEYFIAPTYDKQTFVTYLSTVNTNNLNGGESKFVSSIAELPSMVNANNSIILISDFDTDEDVKDITIQNNTYLIGVGTQRGDTVKDKEGQTMYKNDQILKSSLNKKNISTLGKDYIILDSYMNDKSLSFLQTFNNGTVINKNIDFFSTIGTIFVLLSL